MANDNRTTADLRKTLMDAIESVRTGDMENATARTIATLSDKVIDTVRLEMEYSSLLVRLKKTGDTMTSAPVGLIGNEPKPDEPEHDEPETEAPKAIEHNTAEPESESDHNYPTCGECGNPCNAGVITWDGVDFCKPSCKSTYRRNTN